MSSPDTRRNESQQDARVCVPDFTVISFHTDDKYYHLAGIELRQDCERLGISHRIQEFRRDPNEEWDAICRKKIAFYCDSIRACHTPVLWVDVDCRIVSLPEALIGTRFDMVGYLRGFRHPRDFHRAEVSRYWTPSILFFGHNERVLRFLDYMVEIESASTARATDDYFLEEAWQGFPEQLSTAILPPNTVARRADDITESTYFLFGASGNVDAFRPLVERRVPIASTERMRRHVLDAEAALAVESGQLKEARVLARRASQIGGPQRTPTLRYAEGLKRSGEFGAEVEALTECLVDPQLRLTALKRLVVARSKNREPLAETRAFLERFLSDQDAECAAFAKSRLFQLDLDERAARMRCKSKDRVRLWWMQTPYPGNFGDLLNPYIVEKVTGVPPLFANKNERMLAIGSVIKFAERGVTVWGAGTPRSSDTVSPDAEFLAVRGPLTRELVRRNGGTCPDIFGDPALLLPKIYAPPRKAPTYKLGIIRHLSHRATRVADDDVKEISIVRCGYDEFHAFIDEVLDCERILSSSLHGLIVANAYGIPARWCTFSQAARQIPGDGVKFADYWLSVGLPLQEVLDLSGVESIGLSLAGAVDRTVDIKFDANRLVDAFPARWIRQSQLLG